MSYCKFCFKWCHQVDPEMLEVINSMYTTSRKMVKYSMQGFLNEELDLKDKVMDYEEKIHKLQKKALNKIAIHMAEDEVMDKDRSTLLSDIITGYQSI